MGNRHRKKKKRTPRGRKRRQTETLQEDLAGADGGVTKPEQGEGDDGEDGGDDQEDKEARRDGGGLIQERRGVVWDKIVAQDGLENQIELGIDVLKIDRRGLSDYHYSSSPLGILIN